MNQQEIETYETLLNEMLNSDDFRFGYVAGSNNFFVKSAGFSIVWSGKYQALIPSIELPSMYNVFPPAVFNKIDILRHRGSDVLVYIPSSIEDEFQASTALDCKVLPFQLASAIEMLLHKAKEMIDVHSINMR